MNTDEYLKLAEVEDTMWYFWSLHGHIRRELNAHPPKESARLLDAGCGTGGLILNLQKTWPNWHYSGIDFSALACELARKRCGPLVDIREASITALPFPDESFDVVVSADVICQVDDPGLAVREFLRVLRPNGLLIVSVPAYMWMWSYHDDNCQTKRRFVRKEIAALVQAAGGRMLRLSHLNALPFPAIWAKRKLFRSASDTSDVKRYPGLIEVGFRGLAGLEHAWMRTGGNWAWGSSVFAVAVK